MKKKLSTLVSVVLGFTLALVLGAVFLFVPFGSENETVRETIVGSVQRSGEYHSTSTGSYTSLLTNPVVALKSGVGTLGSVTITGANTGVMHFFNATTTDVNDRTGNLSTSSIWLGSIPASTAAGTYTFDTVFFDGLFVEIVGTPPTSTITFR